MLTSSTPTVRACLVALVVLLVTSHVVRSADPHPYHEGNYGTAGLSHADAAGSRATWDYANLNEWPELCRTGSRQSPISFANVDPSEVVKDAPLKRLQFSSKCFFPKDETQMRIVNEGTVNMVSFERQGRLPEDLSECTVVDPLSKNRTYYFSELHFHATSEHKFRSLRPDVEMHISFVTDEVKEKKRDVLMVAVMLKASTTINSTSVQALRHILVDGSLPRRHAMTTCYLTEDFSITSLLPARESYLLYDGSDTRPPCHENVRWVVMSSPILISRVAVGKLRDAMDQLLPNDFHRFGNARPPQALNGRRVYRFDDASVPQGGRRSEGNLDDAWTRRNNNNSNNGNGADVMNETAEDEIYKVVADEGFGDYDVDIRSYGDDAKSVLPRTTRHPSTTEAPAGANVTEVAAGESATTAAADEEASEEAPTHHEHAKTTTTSEADNQTTTTPSNASTDEPELTKDPAGEAANISDNVSDTETPEPTPMEYGSADGTAASTAELSSTKKPASGKDKKRRDVSTQNESDSIGRAEESAKATAKSAWSRLKAFSSRAVSTMSVYAERHPGRAALILACSIAILFLIYTCIRGWQSPVYVVGIDPRELQPLNPNPAFGQYGGTGASAVRPANQRVE